MKNFFFGGVVDFEMRHRWWTKVPAPGYACPTTGESTWHGSDRKPCHAAESLEGASSAAAKAKGNLDWCLVPRQAKRQFLPA